MHRKQVSEFVAKEHQKLVAFVRSRLQDSSERDGEDIVQDVMINLFDRADVTAPIDNLSAYIYRCLRNRVIDILRSRKRTLSLDAELEKGAKSTLADLLHDVRYSTVSDLEQQEIRHEMYAAIDALADEEKAVVIATELEERTFRELAGEWGIPLGTLLARKSRAMQKIRKALALSNH